MMPMRFFVFVLVCCLGLAGCTAPVDKPVSGSPTPVQTFAHIDPVRLNIARIEITNVSNDPSPPADFKISLVDKTMQYFGRKVVASPYADPSQGFLSVKIQQASVQKEHQLAKGTVPKSLGVGGADVYMLKLTLLVELHDAQGYVTHGKSLVANRRLSLSEHSSIAEREKLQLESVEALFNVLDPKLTHILLGDMQLRTL